MRTIITTVGTSLLSGRGRPWAGWRIGQPLPAAVTVSGWLRGADPVIASAETHTWLRLGLPDAPTAHRVVLIHSDTTDGVFCADQLEAYLKGAGVDTELRRVYKLKHAGPGTDAETFNQGLRRLVRELAEAARTGAGRGEVVLAATGGFKAEIAVANLAAALLKLPVYYIYEGFTHLIRIEPLPVALEPEWLRSGPGRALLERLRGKETVSRVDVQGLLRADGRLELLLESVTEDGVNYVTLNLLGELAAEALESPVVDWPPVIDAEPSTKIRLDSAAHHRPEGWERTVDLLARSPFVRFVRYDAAAGNRPGVSAAPDNVADLFVVVADKGPALGLRVVTTAETGPHRDLLVRHLRTQLGM